MPREAMEIFLTSVQFVDGGKGNILRHIFRITQLVETMEISLTLVKLIDGGEIS